MQLDLNQQKAAVYNQGNSIIIAGAGSGKTTTLIYKVNNLIQNCGVSEKEILVISFTNKAVDNFKEKVKHNIDVYTFHKLALSICEQVKEIYIAEDYILYDVIISTLSEINVTLKKKLYKLFRHDYKKFSPDNYKKIIEEKSFNSLVNTITSICRIIKTNNIDINKLKTSIFRKNEIIVLYLCKIIISSYNATLKENEMMDFDDLIISATKLIKCQKALIPYKYIIVDEYQDISRIRLDFLEALVSCNKGIVCVVGDDWQAIFGFSGSNIDLFYNFQKYFKNVKVFYLDNSYRCPKIILEKSGKFILKNKSQIRKNVKAISAVKGHIYKIYYNNKQKSFKKIVTKLIKYNKKILVLSRNNFDIYEYLFPGMDYDGETFKINNQIYKNILFMTIHKAKGLEADIVIILNLSSDQNGFPSTKKIDIIEKINPTREQIKNAEERRLFYVALTRTKSDVYLLVDSKMPSSFVKEI